MTKSSLVTRLKGLTRKEEGQALVLVCAALLVVLGMAGIGVDVGYLKYQRHQMQKAADAGALAAASVMTYSSDDTLIKKAALNEAKANGYVDGSNNISVTVNHPPQSGPFSGNSAYVEVYVAQPRPNFFLQTFGYRTTNVRARAVGSSKADASGCIIALDPTDPKTFLADGNVTVSTSCGIVVDSSDQNALFKNGVSGLVQATGGAQIGVVGGSQGGPFSPTPVTGIAPVTDPFIGLAAPSTSGPCLTFDPTQTTVSPGKYCRGIQITSSDTYTFTAGTYILYGGGLTIGGSAKVQGTGVMFYNTGTNAGVFKYGPITMAGSSTSNLSASLDPSNPYAGILFFQDRNYISTKPTDTSTVTGGNGATFVGAMYFPGTQLKYAGTPGLVSSTVIVAWEVEFTGDTNINNDFLNNGGSPLHTASIAE